MLTKAQRNMVLVALDMIEASEWDRFCEEYTKKTCQYASAIEFRLIKEEINIDNN